MALVGGKANEKTGTYLIEYTNGSESVKTIKDVEQFKSLIDSQNVSNERIMRIDIPTSKTTTEQLLWINNPEE